MTRDEAIAALVKINKKYARCYTDDYYQLQLEIFEAFGMLKLDEPMTKREQFQKALLHDNLGINGVVMKCYDKVHGHD
jgi:hypothetical protein